VNQEVDSTDKRQGDAYQNEWLWCSEEPVDYWARETTEEWQVVTGVKIKLQVGWVVLRVLWVRETTLVFNMLTDLQPVKIFEVELGDSAGSKLDLIRQNFNSIRFSSLLLRFSRLRPFMINYELWSALSNVLAKLFSYFFEISCKWTVT